MIQTSTELATKTEIDTNTQTLLATEVSGK